MLLSDSDLEIDNFVYIPLMNNRDYENRYFVNEANWYMWLYRVLAFRSPIEGSSFSLSIGLLASELM